MRKLACVPPRLKTVDPLHTRWTSKKQTTYKVQLNQIKIRINEARFFPIKFEYKRSSGIFKAGIIFLCSLICDTITLFDAG